MNIKDKIAYIHKMRNEHGLSADNICDIVSQQGGYISVSTARRLIAHDAVTKPFKFNTVDPVFRALKAEYEETPHPETTASTAPDYAYPHYSREQYERLIMILKESNERLRTENQQLKERSSKQGRMLDLLWYNALEAARKEV